MKIRKIVFPIIFICFVILFLGEKIKYIRLREDYIRTNLSLMIFKNSSVVDVEVLPSAHDNSTYIIQILFDDGGSLDLSNVNEDGTEIMEIHAVDEYLVWFCPEESLRPLRQEKKMQLYSMIVEEPLDTIINIVNTYPKISRFVNNLPDLDDFKTDEDKSFSEVVDRVIYVDKPVLNNIFLIDGYKYHLFKLNRDVLWRFRLYDGK
jgi:hypothetical protein